jgi:hypothetical protein
MIRPPCVRARRLPDLLARTTGRVSRAFDARQGSCLPRSTTAVLGARCRRSDKYRRCRQQLGGGRQGWYLSSQWRLRIRPNVLIHRIPWLCMLVFRFSISSKFLNEYRWRAGYRFIITDNARSVIHGCRKTCCARRGFPTKSPWPRAEITSTGRTSRHTRGSAPRPVRARTATGVRNPALETSTAAGKTLSGRLHSSGSSFRPYECQRSMTSAPAGFCVRLRRLWDHCRCCPARGGR